MLQSTVQQFAPEFSKKEVHRSGVEPGHHQGDTGVAGRTYDPDDPSRLVADIAQPAGYRRAATRQSRSALFVRPAPRPGYRFQTARLPDAPARFPSGGQQAPVFNPHSTDEAFNAGI